MFPFFWFFVQITALEVASASRILVDNNIHQTVPPTARFGVNYGAFDRGAELRSNDEAFDENLWEKSGLFEGDIMFYDQNMKNGVINKALRWDKATIPFYIEELHFNDTEIETILSAIKEFHERSCLRFKPYRSSDAAFLVITGNDSGCWSSVGMVGEGGQQLNVNSPKCVRKGVVMHELLHACGFYHQQSASDRDDFVKILWENIQPGKEYNFQKYDASEVTDFNTTYDYASIMHYSGKAFSKNDNFTIVALRNISTLGQRDGFTDTDLAKLNRMYNDSCHQADTSDDQFASIIDWFRTLFN